MHNLDLNYGTESREEDPSFFTTKSSIVNYLKLMPDEIKPPRNAIEESIASNSDITKNC